MNQRRHLTGEHLVLEEQWLPLNIFVMSCWESLGRAANPAGGSTKSKTWTGAFGVLGRLPLDYPVQRGLQRGRQTPTQSRVGRKQTMTPTELFVGR